MIFNTENTNEVNNADCYYYRLKESKKTIEIKPLSGTRTARQNRSIHKFFDMISDGLNDLGNEFNYTGIKGFDLSTRWTRVIVKELFWKPVQLTLFGIDSTKELDTQMINEIAEIIIKFFGEKGVTIEFPHDKNN